MLIKIWSKIEPDNLLHQFFNSQFKSDCRQDLCYDDEFLQVVNGYYCKGKKAKTYKAVFIFKKILEKIYEKIKEIYFDFTPPKLPITFSSGSWDENVWKASRLFLKHPKRFLDEAVKMFGVNRKSRLDKFLRAINNRRKYAGLPTFSI